MTHRVLARVDFLCKYGCVLTRQRERGQRERDRARSRERAREFAHFADGLVC